MVSGRKEFELWLYYPQLVFPLLDPNFSFFKIYKMYFILSATLFDENLNKLINKIIIKLNKYINKIWSDILADRYKKLEFPYFSEAKQICKNGEKIENEEEFISR